ncbi:MAG: 1-acyl-sn-glycerol-3-phosphate acyltransferase, partial [Sandaracinaceae bacterium]|nr:1-acyl-sn-glycerol-3-phosphate acyltransferase [Sandaracinaceae bacterium]
MPRRSRASASTDDRNSAATVVPGTSTEGAKAKPAKRKRSLLQQAPSKPLPSDVAPSASPPAEESQSPPPAPHQGANEQASQFASPRRRVRARAMLKENSTPPILQSSAEPSSQSGEVKVPTPALREERHAGERPAPSFSELGPSSGGPLPSAALDFSNPPIEKSGQDANTPHASSLLSTAEEPRDRGAWEAISQHDGIDPFGHDPIAASRVQPLLDWLYRHWFRVEVKGIDALPTSGPCLLVANHGGAFPWDGLMLDAALRLHRGIRLRWLIEDAIAHAPFVGTFLTRLGAVRACPENAERLLGASSFVAVFPEGAKGLTKPWRKRYAIQRFGRGGFVRLALRTGTPIVPVGIVGSDDAHPVLGHSEWLGRWFGMAFLPITPTFPWLGPIGLVPFPVRWVICFGQPIDLGARGDCSLEDPLKIHATAEEVRS